MENLAIKNPSRRNFLMYCASRRGGRSHTRRRRCLPYKQRPGATPAAPATFQLFTAQTIQDDSKALQANPGNNNLVGPERISRLLLLPRKQRAA
jgi:hypothetical protein